jgi:hypothetical protein
MRMSQIQKARSVYESYILRWLLQHILPWIVHVFATIKGCSENQGFWDAMLTIEFAIPTSGKNCERTAVLAL